MAQAHNPAQLWAPFGAFPQMVLVGEGQTVHLKGQVLLDPDGAVVDADWIFKAQLLCFSHKTLTLFIKLFACGDEVVDSEVYPLSSAVL